MKTWFAATRRFLQNRLTPGTIARSFRSLIGSAAAFPGSARYWEQRYLAGGNSGAGSYGRLADWKADVVNGFVAENAVRQVIEHGFGDGNQLRLARYPDYLGLDVSHTAIALCRERFATDPSKRFMHVADYQGETCELALSMDVIFHLVEDEVYRAYMERLFSSAERWVIIYSSNREQTTDAPHVRHRDFTAYVRTRETDWKLVKSIRNKFPYDIRNPDNTSFSDFYFFEKSGLVDAGTRDKR